MFRAVFERHAGKRELRRGLLSARADLPPEEVAAAEVSIARHAAALPELAAARTVAGYVSIGREPGTRQLLEALEARGVRVLLPVLREDRDLDWAPYQGAEALVRRGVGGRAALWEPAGEPLGRRAIETADVVLLPGLAVDARGMRLGRGGGSYDRVLARLAAADARPTLAVLLYADEVLERVPAEPHDRPVRLAVTPAGVRRFGAG